MKTTAEEFFRNKIKEIYERNKVDKPVITLSRELMNAEEAMRWAHEFKELHLLEYAKQFKYDYSKKCECGNGRIGETWCCNQCGLPVEKDSSEYASIKEDKSVNQNFLDYLKIAKEDFVNEVNKQEWKTYLRTAAESFIIAFDQVVSKLPSQFKEDKWISCYSCKINEVVTDGYCNCCGAKQLSYSPPKA